ncbi:MAG: efflux RND transporter periplasmic adaptor subunit [bacterium]
MRIPCKLSVMIKTGLTFIVIFCYSGCKQAGTQSRKSEHGDHSGHQEHSEHTVHKEHNENEEHRRNGEQSGHEEHEEHAENEDRVEHVEHNEHDEHETDLKLSKNAISMAGIQIDCVKTGRIQRTIELMGEVGCNEDRIAHIVPRFPGITKNIYKNLGDYVSVDEVIAEVESNESLTLYKIKSLIAGRVVEKHITLGEFVSNESTIFMIADLSRVWINLAVYTKNAGNIKTGQEVIIYAVGNNHQAKGTITYLDPVYNKKTRSFTARAVIPNPNNLWRPGTFVKGEIFTETPVDVPIISTAAIQTVNGKTCVFVPEKPGLFRPVEITAGHIGKQFTHCISGLKPGDEYVTEGSFEIKAKIVTSALSGHAGHGH